MVLEYRSLCPAEMLDQFQWPWTQKHFVQQLNQMLTLQSEIRAKNTVAESVTDLGLTLIHRNSWMFSTEAEPDPGVPLRHS